MKKSFLLVGFMIAGILLSGCVISNDQPPVVGGDRDEHGCIGSAGYSWCEEKQECIRPWEEDCGVVAQAMGKLVLLVSDKEADINDFQSLNVSFEKAIVYRVDDNSGTVEIALDNKTVDLTTVVGGLAFPLVELDLNAGAYSKVSLVVSSVEAILKDGNAADVKVPSQSLKIVKPFTIGADSETRFVFDIEVVKKGQSNVGTGFETRFGQSNEYNLLPVIGKSGVVGKDLNESDVSVKEKENIRKSAEEFCGKENVAEVAVCGEYIKVTSGLLGGGSSFYSLEEGSLSEPVVCPVVGPDSMAEECKQLLFESNCIDIKVC